MLCCLFCLNYFSAEMLTLNDKDRIFCYLLYLYFKEFSYQFYELEFLSYTAISCYKFKFRQPRIPQGVAPG
jgi:hypothetical protein